MINILKSPVRRRAEKERAILYDELVEITMELNKLNALPTSERSRLIVRKGDIKDKITLIDKILYNL